MEQLEQRVAIGFELGGPDHLAPLQGLPVAGLPGGERLERAVVEDDVRRLSLAPGLLSPPGLEPLEDDRVGLGGDRWGQCRCGLPAPATGPCPGGAARRRRRECQLGPVLPLGDAAALRREREYERTG